MITWLRRCFLAAVAAGAGYGAWVLWRGRAPEVDQPQWPPIDPPTAPRAGSRADRPTDTSAQPAAAFMAPSPVVSSTTATTTADAAWVDPLDDGGCPLSHPVKANANSGIFHVPGGRFYDRTKAERCYLTPEGAADDGFRAAKS